MSVRGLHTLSGAIHQSFSTFGVFGGEKPELIPTGIGPIDALMGGMLPGTIWVPGARMNKGKSTLLQNMAYAAVLAGYPAVYCSNEDAIAVVGGKMQSRMSGIPLIDLCRSGYMLGQDHGIRRALEQSEKLPLFLSFPPNRKKSAIEKHVRDCIEATKARVFYFDYLTTVLKDGHLDNRNHFAEVLSSLRDIAREYNIPVVCSSQLTRDKNQSSDNYEPKISDLAETGSVEQIADVVLLLWSDESGQRLLSVAKNKIAGHVRPKMKINFNINTEIMSVEEIVQ